MSDETIKVEIHLSKRQIKALSYLHAEGKKVLSREEIRSLIANAFSEEVKQAEAAYSAFKKSIQ